MFVLNDLWWGNIAPSERAVKRGSEYQQASRRAEALADELREELPPEGKQAFEAYENEQITLCSISECDAFIKGVRFGVQMMIDTLLPIDTTLPPIVEESA